MTDTFIHLHNHTQYSLADSSLKEKKFAKRAKELGMKSLAITDHGVMYGVIDFYKACRDEGIKPIIGMEAYIAPRMNTMMQAKIDDANYHLVLLCETNQGYQNLMKISSDASINGFYYRARTDKTKLKQYHEGLIALSACLGGEVQQWLMKGDYNLAKDTALQYNEIFGQNNFFLELQEHGIPEQAEVNRLLIQMSNETGIPLVCTNDCHYLNPEDAEAHDVLMAIQAKTTIDDDKRKKYPTNEFYVKTQEEMWNIFGYIPEALENTVKIADRCNVTIEFGVNKLPPFKIPSMFNMSNYEFCKQLCYEGAKKMYGELTQEVIERTEYELSVVEKMGYINYFLIVWDFFRFCMDGTEEYGEPPREDWEPILTGPGRGSGAGSILTYELGITKIDPLKYNLIFERFLDPSRISMPDLDSDFQDDRRQEVIDYTIRKYGRKSVSQIITYGTMAARAAIRAVGRALSLPYSLQDQIAKMIPIEVGMTIEKALDINSDLKNKYDSDEDAKKLIDTALSLEGLPRYTSTHAAGVLIVDERGVDEHVPLWNNDGAIVCQYPMNILEELGLLKMDFLGLKTLTVISNAIKYTEKNHGIKLDLDELYKIKDLKPLKLIGDGKTVGVFQLESGGMTQFMTELKPQTLEDIIAGISFYRPGPMQYIPDFLENRRHPEDIKYVFEELKPILSETFGVLAYQEQIMRMVIAIAGYAKSDSDTFRKVISKKQKQYLPLHKRWFVDGRGTEDDDGYGHTKKYTPIPGGVALGHDRAKLEKTFTEMQDFASYCFE